MRAVLLALVLGPLLVALYARGQCIPDYEDFIISNEGIPNQLLFAENTPIGCVQSAPDVYSSQTHLAFIDHEFTFVTESNAATGFEWVVVNAGNATLLDFVGTEVDDDFTADPPHSTQTHTFLPLAAGVTDVVLRSQPPAHLASERVPFNQMTYTVEVRKFFALPPDRIDEDTYHEYLIIEDPGPSQVTTVA